MHHTYTVAINSDKLSMSDEAAPNDEVCHGEPWCYAPSCLSALAPSTQRQAATHITNLSPSTFNSPLKKQQPVI